MYSNPNKCMRGECLWGIRFIWEREEEEESIITLEKFKSQIRLKGHVKSNILIIQYMCFFHHSKVKKAKNLFFCSMKRY